MEYRGHLPDTSGTNLKLEVVSAATAHTVKLVKMIRIWSSSNRGPHLPGSDPSLYMALCGVWLSEDVL